MQEAHTHYEASVEHVLHSNFTSLLSMLRVRFLSQLLNLHPFESIVSDEVALRSIEVLS